MVLEKTWWTNLATETHNETSVHCSSVVPISMKIVGLVNAVGPWWVASMVIWNFENWDWFFCNVWRYAFWRFGWGTATCLELPPNLDSEKFPVLWQVNANAPDFAACFERNTNPS